MKQRPFDKVIIVGTGLIGASIGLNLISKRLAREVIGVGRGEPNLRAARRRRAIHHSWRIQGTRDLFRGPYADGLLEADLIVLAGPVKTIARFLEVIPADIVSRMKRGAIITDVGSTKREIVKLGRRIVGPATFVGGHPIAGTEQSGAGAAVADLFQGRMVLLTPTPRTPASAVKKLRDLWRQLGATVVSMTAQIHDRLLSRVSHLPHVVAYTLVNSVGEPKRMSSLVAGGFRDTTRIASSDPAMWRDICLDNRDEILRAMAGFEKEWKGLKAALRKGDGADLQRYFARGKRQRDHYVRR